MTTAPALRGSRCIGGAGCTATVYPAQDTCPRCAAPTAPVVLSTDGRVWTWTVQRIAPKAPPYVAPPGGFRAFAVGYVELAEGIRVAAVIDTADVDAVHVGLPVRLHAGGGVPRATPIEE